jgi:hypothetical protein
MTSFNLGTQQTRMTQVIDPSHPPVVRAMEAKADLGEIRYGTFVGLDDDSLIIAWDGVTGAEATSTLHGVLVETIDTDDEFTARVLVHGCVKQDSLLVKDATPAAPTAAQIALIEALGIWANAGEL